MRTVTEPASFLPRLGRAGSRAAELHREFTDVGAKPRPRTLAYFGLYRWVGTIGSLVLAAGALGSGATPVVDNPYTRFPGGAILSQLLQASSVMAFVGVSLLAVAWIGMAPHLGVPLPGRRATSDSIPVVGLWTTLAAWAVPLLFTAPIFTQDIYSYLANGSIVRQGLDPYAAGPIELLGNDHRLARSVPFIWAHSPSPYGPVALGIAAAISALTSDHIALGVLAHRTVNMVGIVCCGWALIRLARRCRVAAAPAFWLGILNPLVFLHLIGGIHNEAIMLGLLLVGLEVGLGALREEIRYSRLALGGLLVACAGMVKVSAFLVLGFLGMAAARRLVRSHGLRPGAAVGLSALFFALVTAATIAAVTLITGIGLGWVTGQGGAATVRSWMSLTTEIGVIAGGIGMFLGLGDHTEAILLITRIVGLVLAGSFSIRMLLATLRGTIHPVGGVGASMFVVVIFFPVVQPWYLLWAIVPLAAWANRPFFQWPVIGYSVIVSFVTLPRGLSLPPGTVLGIYLTAAIAIAAVLGAGAWWLRRIGYRPLD